MCIRLLFELDNKLYYTTANLRRQLNRPSKRPRIDQVSVSGIARGLVNNSYVRLSHHLGPNQVCTLFGSKGGSTLISGRAYIAAGYGLNPDDLWRRCFLVLFALTVAFHILQVIALEFSPVGAEFTLPYQLTPWLLQQHGAKLSRCIFAKETEELKKRNDALKVKKMHNHERDEEKEPVPRHRRYEGAQVWRLFLMSPV